MGLARRRGMGKVFVDTEVCHRTRRMHAADIPPRPHTPDWLAVEQTLEIRHAPEFAALRKKTAELYRRRRARRDSRLQYVTSPWP